LRTCVFHFSGSRLLEGRGVVEPGHRAGAPSWRRAATAAAAELGARRGRGCSLEWVPQQKVLLGREKEHCANIRSVQQKETLQKPFKNRA